MRIGSTSRWRRGGLVLLGVLIMGASAGAQSDASLGMAPASPAGSGRVVHEEQWAGWLAEALGLTGIFAEEPPREELLGLLCADRGQGDEPGALRQVQDASPGAGGHARFRVELEATALYRLAVQGQGRQRWLIDGQVLEHIESGGLGIAMTSALIPLRQGSHELEVFMGSRGQVDRLDLSVVRSVCVAPVDGWHADRPLTYAAAARTLVHAMGLIPLLPMRGEPITLAGSDHQPAEAPARLGIDPRLDFDAPQPELREYSVSVVDPGMYSIRALVRGPGDQLWSLDERYQSRVHLDGDDRDVNVMSVPLASGRHVIRVLLPVGGDVEEIELSRHASGGNDELSVIARLGLPTRAPKALVTWSEANRYLDAEVFNVRTSAFLRDEALRGRAMPVVLAERESEFQGWRPLSPALPGDL